MYDNVYVAPRTLVKAVLNVSSTSCNNERQSFAKLSYSAIDNVLTNHSRFARLLSGAHPLECDDDSKQAVPRWNSLLGLSLGYLVALLICFQLATDELMLYYMITC